MKKRNKIIVMSCIVFTAALTIAVCSGRMTGTDGDSPAGIKSHTEQTEHAQKEVTSAEAEAAQNEVTSAKAEAIQNEGAQTETAGNASLEDEIPHNVKWNESKYTTTLKGKTIEYVLRDKKVEVKENDKLVFETQDDYYVSDLLVYDIDADGIEDMCLMLWKRGIYGEYRPFWEEKTEEEDKYSQHLFAYEWRDEELKPKWMSSRLGMIVDEVFNTDDKLHLVDTTGKETVWVWKSWGFKLYE